MLVNNTDYYVAGLWTGNQTTIPNDTFARWDLTDHTMFLNFSDPSINHVRDQDWAPEKALVFENYGPNDWVYLIIEGVANRAGKRTFFPLFHPVNEPT